jgi:hypothetical protein
MVMVYLNDICHIHLVRLKKAMKKNSARKPVLLGTVHNRVILVNAYIKLYWSLVDLSGSGQV